MNVLQYYPGFFEKYIIHIYTHNNQQQHQQQIKQNEGAVFGLLSYVAFTLTFVH